MRVVVVFLLLFIHNMMPSRRAAATTIRSVHRRHDTVIGDILDMTWGYWWVAGCCGWYDTDSTRIVRVDDDP